MRKKSYTHAPGPQDMFLCGRRVSPRHTAVQAGEQPSCDACRAIVEQPFTPTAAQIAEREAIEGV